MQSLTLAAVIRELSVLAGRRVVAVIARDAWEHHIQLEQDVAVVVSLHPDHNTLYVTSRSGGREAPASPLTRTLARTLVGSRLGAVAQAGLDRVAALRFQGRDRLGDRVAYQVVLEFTGKGANVVVLEGDDPWAGKIVDRLRDDRSKVHPRRLHPGARYAHPVSGKTDLTVADDTTLAEALRASGTPPTWRRLADTWEGMGLEVAREVLSAHEAGTDGTPPVDVAETELARRWRAFAASVQAPGGGAPSGDRFAPALVEAGGDVQALCFVPTAQTGAPATVTRFDSVSDALQEAHFRFRTRSRDTRQSTLAVNLQTARRRTEKALGALDRAENDDRDPRTMRRVGEALLAGAHNLGKGETSAEIMLPDTGETVTVRLNPALSAADNAELYFKKARKADRSGRVIDDRRGELEETRDALEDLGARLAAFGDGEPDPAWLADAKRLGVALPRGQAEQVRDTAPGRELPGALQPRRYDLGQGWEVMVGRSDKGNHVLTFELSRPDDTWMHASGCPGSHVVLRHDERGKEPPRDVLLAAAAMAAFFSKARGAAKVPVTVAAKRQVRRPRKAPIGQALVGEHKTIMVAPVDPDARRSR